jgi:hypothetical protein
MRSALPICLLTTVMMTVPTTLTALGTVPFRATFATEPVVVGFCGPACLTLDIGGEGQATHLGRTDIAGPSQVDLMSGVQTGTSVLTAANGDTLVIAFEGSAVPEGPTPNDPVNFGGTWEVTAGTGRFENAVGSGTYSGRAAGPVGLLRLIGRVSRPSHGQ